MSRKDHFGAAMPGGRQQFPGIRWVPIMGVYGGVQDSDPNPFKSEPTLLQNQYNAYILNNTNDTVREGKYLNLNNLDGTGLRYWFAGGRKYRWRDMLKDENVAPSSREEARDPAWANYKWNPGTFNGVSGGDYIREMLDNCTQASTAGALAGTDRCKLSVFVATTATAERNPIPNWVKDPTLSTIYHTGFGGKKLYWTDGDTADGPGKDHLRLDRPGPCAAMTDWLIALIRQYGEDPRIASIVQGEYYPNDDDRDGDGIPDWLPYEDEWTLGEEPYPGPDTQKIYHGNMHDIWMEVMRYAPRDKNNNRVTLIQGQPITSGGDWSKEEVEHTTVGSSGSGVSLFRTGVTTTLRNFVYRKVPSQHQVNPGNLNDPLDPATWPTISNPFGLAVGDHTIEYQHVTWYFSDKGVTPMDSLLLRDQSSLVDDWHQAYERFGPNGTDAATWGQIPHYPTRYSN